jgi:hypothetical protein
MLAHAQPFGTPARSKGSRDYFFSGFSGFFGPSTAGSDLM